MIVNDQDNVQQNMATATSAHGMAAPTITLSNIFSRFPTTSGLSKQGQDYLTQLRENLEDTSRSCVAKMIKLATPPESYVFTKDDFGIIVVFSEAQNLAFQSQMNQAQQQYTFGVKQAEKEVYAGQSIRLAMDTLRNIPDAPKKFIGSIVVTPEDYGRASKAAEHIRGALTVATTEYKDLGIDAFRDAKFSIDPNIGRVEQYVDAVSPHQIMAAHTQGFILKASIKDNTGAYGVPTPIAAVLSFTDFAPSPEQQIGWQQPTVKKFTPIIRITDIVTHIPMPFILDMALTFATYVYAKCGHWQEQFSITSKDSINIGNLFVDDKGLVNIEQKDKDAFISTVMNFPAITLDVTEGRAWCCGMHLYMGEDSASNNQLLDKYSKLLKIPRVEFDRLKTPKVVINTFSEYTGTLIMSGVVVDSRYLTYLQAVKKCPREDVLGLMRYMKKNTEKLNIIKKINDSFIPLTETTISVLNTEFLAKVLSVFTNVFVVDTQNITQNSFQAAYDFSSVSELGQSLFNSGDFGLGYTSRNITTNNFGNFYF